MKSVMVIILSSSGSTPLSSAIIYGNTVAAILNVKFRVFALSAGSNFILVVGCALREEALIPPTAAQ
jgi:hypothetical protein